MSFVAKHLRLIVAAVIALALIALPAFAFGQDVPAVVHEMIPNALKPGEQPFPWWAQLIVTALGALGTFALGMLAKYLGKLTDWVAEKTSLAFLRNVDEIVMGVVIDLYNTQVETWKAASADGKLTPAEVSKAKALAFGSARALVDWDQWGAMFGVSSDIALETRIERAVTVAKNTARAAKGPRVDPSRPSTPS